MTNYKWCMSCIASGIDVVELQVIHRPKRLENHVAEPVVCTIERIGS